MNQILKIHLILFSLALAFAASAGSAWANTAANTRIINTVNLTYNGGQTASATVTVTVALVPAVPTITPVANMSGPYPTPLIDAYVLTNNANGPDTFILTAGTNTLINTTSVAAIPGSPAPATPVTLGATVTVSGSNTTGGYTNLLVPSDGVNDNSVNGIRVGDTVYINNTDERTVTAITDNTSGTSIIQTTSLATLPGAGAVIGQRITVHATVTPNNITTAGSTVTVNTTMTATSQADNSVFAISGNVGNTFFSGSATLAKYVRVVKPSPPAGTGSPYVYNSNSYYQAGITAAPGETLEYILVATNTGTDALSPASITDTLPTTYVSLKTGVYSGGRDISYLNETGIASYLTSTAADDAATYASPNLTVNVGTGATSAAGGTIASGATVRVLYQVTVNP